MGCVCRQPLLGTILPRQTRPQLRSWLQRVGRLAVRSPALLSKAQTIYSNYCISKDLLFYIPTSHMPFSVSLGVRLWNPKRLPWRMSTCSLIAAGPHGDEKKLSSENAVLYLLKPHCSFADPSRNPFVIFIWSKFTLYSQPLDISGENFHCQGEKWDSQIWLFQSISSSSLIRSHEKKRGLEKCISKGSFLTIFLL